jgi:hypothetical protein
LRDISSDAIVIRSQNISSLSIIEKLFVQNQNEGFFYSSGWHAYSEATPDHKYLLQVAELRKHHALVIRKTIV